MTHWDPALVTSLRVGHVLFAAAWVGAALHQTFVVAPNLSQSTGSTRREFGGRILPAALRYQNIVGGLSILSGLALVYAVRDGFSGWGDTAGRLILFAIVASVAALYLLNFAVRPSLRAVEKFRAGQGHEADEPLPAPIAFLQKRAAFTSQLMLALLLAVLVAMVVAGAI